jgi:archaellum component FlaF (FlaF/FlaG flagellin family)
MGFSTTAVFAVLFVVSIVAIVELFASQDEYTSIISYEEKKGLAGHLAEIRSNIEIINVTLSGGVVNMTVVNTGNIALDPGQVYLMINDNWIPENSYSVILLNSSGSGYWEPTEAIRITYPTYLTEAITVKIVAETGVEDRYEYRY